MKEVEFINSRVEQVRSQQQQYFTNDCPAKAENSDGGASDAKKESPLLSRDQRNAIIPVLRKFIDILLIYRSTLNHCFSNEKSNVLPSENHPRAIIVQFQQDCLYVNNLLSDLIKDIEINGSYNVLIYETENNRKKEKEEIAIVNDYEKTLKNLHRVRKVLENEIEANSRERKELTEKLLRLKNKTESLKYKRNIESKYVKAKEDARREANYLRLSINRKNLEETLESLSSMEKNEQRVAKEIVKFLQGNITDNEKKISEWQTRYENETSIYKSTNQFLSEEIKEKEEELEKLQLQYRERQQFIDNYLAEKETARELKKIEKHRYDCATKIQAWWRGVMVRRKLGPYRPDEKKKKRSVKSKK